MRERMFATLGIWAAVAFAVDRLLNSLSYSVTSTAEPLQQEIAGVVQTIPQISYSTEFVSGGMQIAVYVLLFVALLCATGATIAIWQDSEGSHQQSAAAAAQKSEKSKRDREMRVKRLLTSMDEDELAALEEQHLNEEEMTVAQLIQQKRNTQEMGR